MFTEIGIENFKAFGKMQRIPLKPITLLYGPNSSGKTSLLQSLLMLKQTQEMEGSDGDALLSRGGYVDLGEYQNFINNHAKKKEFKFGISFNFQQYSEYLSNTTTTLFSGWSAIDDPLSIEFTFFQEEKGQILVKAVKIFHKLDSEPLVIYKNVWSIPALRKVIKVKEEEEKENSKYLTEWRSALKKSVLVLELMNYTNTVLTEDLVAAIDFYAVGYEGDGLLDEDGNLCDSEAIKMGIESGEIKIVGIDKDVYLRDIEDIKTGIESGQLKPRGKWEKTLEYVKILNNLYSNDSCDKIHELEIPPFDRLISLSSCFPKALLVGDEPIFKKIEAFRNMGSLNFNLHEGEVPHRTIIKTDLVILASELLSHYLRRTVYIGPLRALPERVYTFSGRILPHVGKSGEYTPDILYMRKDAVDRVNEWFRQVDIDYEIEVHRMKHEVFEIALKDKKTGWKVTPKDVGFGVSQLLPIIVQGIVSQNNIICIEQPEIHIHPRLQAELGSFIADNIKIQSDKIDAYSEEPGNQFIIETHSEHLILRLLRLIRDTTNGELKEGEKPLRPEDVAVIYAKPTEHGTELMELRISEDGDFIDKWPDGFFTEREKELF